MANITEELNNPQWAEGIYQLETTDPVLGGPNGIANRQAKELAARTQYLKKKQEEYKPGAASTTDAGIVQLSSAIDSDSEELAATPKAVKDAYDKAVAAKEAADGAVKTTGNQEIGGDKTFTGFTTLKKGAIVADSVGDFNANQYLQIGSNNVNSYLHNKKSGKYLSMRNDGELRYDGKRLLNVDDLTGMIPSGAVLYFAGRTAPAGWLKANGAAVSRTTYAALFAAIGITYGAGNGSTTFNLPDLRGEFMRGWDDGRGIDRGRAFGSAQGDAIRNITGSIDSGSHQGRQLFDESTATGALAISRQQWKKWTADISDGGNIPAAFDFDASRVVPTASENRPRNIALLACIKI
ncbi:TPA: phage tail protein [Neisseria lactamica]|uniref:phage tail protein n=1 Tax=Neisseria lactamica TaxID=486 RepID=UPI000302FB14|nr:phage tail protein [Neisseria lactamica]